MCVSKSAPNCLKINRTFSRLVREVPWFNSHYEKTPFCPLLYLFLNERNGARSLTIFVLIPYSLCQATAWSVGQKTRSGKRGPDKAPTAGPRAAPASPLITAGTTTFSPSARTRANLRNSTAGKTSNSHDAAHA